MKRVRNLMEAPPGYWRYKIPELESPTGDVLAHNYQDCLTLVRQRYSANAILAPSNLEDLIHDYMCARIDPRLCIDASAAQPLFQRSFAMKGADALRGTMTLAKIAGRRLVGETVRVSPTEANARGAVCITCSQNVPVEDCKSCAFGNFFAIITNLSGNQHLDHEEKIGGCNICGCGLRAKLWITKNLLTRNLGPKQLARYPAHCWLLRDEII